VHWWAFDKAATDLHDQLAHVKPPMDTTWRLIADSLRHAERFYLPQASHILEGRLFDEDVKELIRLPYDCIAILSDQLFGGRGECDEHGNAIPDAEGWKITIAFSPHGATNRTLGLVNPEKAPKNSILFVSVAYIGGVRHDRKVWVPTPPIVCAMELMVGKPGLYLGILPLASTEAFMAKSGLSRVRLAEEMRDDASSIQNLCVMLNLQNVKSETVCVPIRLSEWRRKNGKPPLYSYRVLNVDGESWTSAKGGRGGGRGVRSHMRRGHIRHLGDCRFVWIRSAFVRGSVKGFVDKEYNVSGGCQ
jgi:hypothetical protein